MNQQENFKLTFIGRFFDAIGKFFLKTTLGKLVSLFCRTFVSFFAPSRDFKTDFKNILSQTFFTGIEIFPVLMCVAIIFGTVVVVETISLMSRMGFIGSVGGILTVIVIRELGPIFTAFFIAGRSGSALATLLGNMQNNSEIDALTLMGVNPVRYLVMPALFGCILAMFIMNICFSVLAICGGFVMTRLMVALVGQSMNVQLTWRFISTSILNAMSWADFLLLVLKPTLFGIIIVINASYQGLQVGHDVRNLAKATSRSVIYSFFYIVLTDALLLVFFIFEYLGEFSKII